MRIAIIGAGWFGCHLGLYLSEKHDVDIYERHDGIFAQASGLNQGRLHLGFHYPRSHVTRTQAKENYDKFMSRYGAFTRRIERNIYAIAKDASLTDFDTYLAILRSSGLPFEIADPTGIGLDNVEGCISCDERVIDTEACKQHFKSRLSHLLRLRTPVLSVEPSARGVIVNGETYDYCIDCTYNQSAFALEKTTYEACVILMYDGFPPDLGLTIMDGDFSSLYPCCVGGRVLHALTAVAHTPIARCDSVAEAEEVLRGIDEPFIKRIRNLFEENISTYYPAFASLARYDHFMTSIKTKFFSNSANRELHVRAEGRTIHVFCGKIGSIFSAEEAVSKLLHE